MSAKLILIYGPPASGKLTVAKHLQNISGISLFHNHLTFDLASVIHELWSEEFFSYCETLRKDVICQALLKGQSLIFTFCFTYPEDLKFVEDIQQIVNSHSASLCLIKLSTSDTSLKARVTEGSRSNFGKIRTVEELSAFLEKYDTLKDIPYGTSLLLDTDKTTPVEAAEKIAQFYQLR